MMAELYGGRYIQIDRVIKRMKHTDFGEPLHDSLNEYEKNFLNAYISGLQTAKTAMGYNPLIFWLNNHGTQNPYTNHPQYEYLLLHFYSHADDWIKEVLREHLRAGDIDNDIIDYVLNGGLLNEVDQMAEPLDGLNYYETVEHTELFKRHTIGNAHAFAVSGKHTASGKPYLVNSIEAPNRMPSKYYIAKLQWKVGKHVYEMTGATMPGQFFFFSGSNGKFSWAWSRLNYDSIDLFKEDFSKNDTRSQY